MNQWRTLFLSLCTLILLVTLGPSVRAQVSLSATPLSSTTALPATAAPSANDDNDSVPPETIGVHALDFAIDAFNTLSEQGSTFVTNIAALPDLSSWFQRQVSNPRLQSRWNDIDNDFIVAIGLPLLAAAVLELFLFPARRLLRQREPRRLPHRLATIFGLFGLKLIPLLVFIGASLMLLDQNETQKVPRFVILNMVYAMTLNYLVLAVMRASLSPYVPNLRFVPATTAQALYAYRWLSFFSSIIIYGYFFMDVAHALHIPTSAITAFIDLLGFVLVVTTIIVINQKRAFVANLLRGDLSVAQRDLSLIESLRLWLARRWHTLAMSYLVIGYSITVLGVDNGLMLMIRGTVLTLLIITITRFLLAATSSHIQSALFRPLLQLVIGVFAIMATAVAWGADIPALFATPIGQRILGAIFSIGTTVILLTLLYETFSAVAEKYLNRRDTDGNVLDVNSRARTLLPMMRNTALIVFIAIVGMVSLSEIGVNIGPLLAGAGVVGVAVGFGSQTLVKDFLTGLFIIIENTIAVGDVVKIGDHAGVVEAMSIRTLRLRDSDGALHILPFSEVTKIINMTRDFAYAQINIGVSYDSNLEHVMGVIRSVGEDLRKDPPFKQMILEPIEILGVDNLGDSSITIAARIRTQPGKQWDVKRMLLLRLKQRFDLEGIEIPFPTMMHIQKTSDGKAT